METDKHSSDMKANRLEILQKVYDRELTPEQAEQKLSALSIVGRSTLLKVVKGDRVKCKYGNSGHKFWTELLEQHPTVDKIQFHESAGFCRFTFKEDERVNNYFYENDFERV